MVFHMSRPTPIVIVKPPNIIRVNIGFATKYAMLLLVIVQIVLLYQARIHFVYSSTFSKM
jgi:hypothetical protein